MPMRLRRCVVPALLAAFWWECPFGGQAAVRAEEIAVSPGVDLGPVLDRAKDGDTITLAGGTYRGNILIKKHNLTLKSKPGERALIKAAPGRGTNVCVSWRNNVVLRDLDLQGGDGYGLDLDNADHALVEGCRVFDVGGEIVKVSPNSDHVTISSCEIFDNRGAAAEGIDAVSVDHLTVVDSFIHDIGKTGAYSKCGSRWCVYERCLFMRCGLNPHTKGMGVLLGQAGSTAHNPFKGEPVEYQNADSVVRNCVFVDIEGAAMGAWKALRPKFYNNTCVNVAKSDRAGVIVLDNSKDVTIVNNIVCVGSSRHLFWIYENGLAGSLVMDSNRYFGGSGRFWDQRSGGGTFTLDEWRAKYGVDAGSSYGDPGLDPDHHLADASPCIDGGRSVEEVRDDYDGGRRSGVYDIGADERGAGEKLGIPPPGGTVGTGRVGFPAPETVVARESEESPPPREKPPRPSQKGAVTIPSAAELERPGPAPKSAGNAPLVVILAAAVLAALGGAYVLSRRKREKRPSRGSRARIDPDGEPPRRQGRPRHGN